MAARRDVPGEKDAALKVGTSNENPEESFNRIGIRRGRFKLTATDGNLASGVSQLDVIPAATRFYLVATIPTG